MSDHTGISWTDATWNPVRGCSRVSEGCRNCYAERMAARFSDPGQPYEGLALRVLKTEGLSKPRWTGVVRLVAEHLGDPLRWKRPRRIFVNSMSDLFHEALTNEQIAAVFGVMAAAPQHTFQVLTKRAARMREWFAWAARHGDGQDLMRFGPSALLTCAWEACSGDAWGDIEPHERLGDLPSADTFGTAWPLPNVWLGASVENQAAADERIPELVRTPAAVRFLSCEPLLGPVILQGDEPPPAMHSRSYLRGIAGDERINWVIAGCESGPGARVCEVEWLRSLRDQCASAGVAYFLKQAIEPTPHDQPAGLLAGIRHFPRSGAALDGSKRKARSVIELPYLDGVQHAAFPVTP